MCCNSVVVEPIVLVGNMGCGCEVVVVSRKAKRQVESFLGIINVSICAIHLFLSSLFRIQLILHPYKLLIEQSMRLVAPKKFFM